MAVHPRTGVAGDRLRHERSHDSFLCGDGADSRFHEQDIIRRPNGVGKLKVDLMLTQTAFMMADFDLKSERVERDHQLRANPNRGIVRGKIEIPAGIERDRMNAIAVQPEQEKLRFRSDVKNHALFFQIGAHAF